MGTRTWDIEELVALVRDATIVGRDLRAQTVRLPTALTEVAEPDARPWDAQLSQEYRADLGAVVETWWRAVAEPGVPQRTEGRRHEGDRWFRHELTHLNLTHQPEFGFVLTITRRLGPTEAPADDDPDAAAFAAPATIVQHLDELGIVLRTEGDVEHVFGRPASDLEGDSVVDYVHPDDRSAGVAMWMEVLSSPDTTRTIQQRIVRPDGSVCWIQSTVMNRLATSSSVLSVSHDIGAQRAQQQVLAASEAELRFLTQEVPVGVFRCDARGELGFTNGRFGQLLPGVASVAALTSALEADDADTVRRAFAEASAGASTTVMTVRTTTGTHLEFRLHGVGDAGGGGGVIGTVDDVTAEIARTTELEQTARLDPLTGLANRRGVEAALRAGSGTPRQLVVFADLDGFKAVNDEHGHEAGDTLLRIIGQRLRDAVRPGDLVSRWGGDEFVVVCSDVPADGQEPVVRRIEAAFVEPIEADGRTHQIGVSLGTAWSDASESMDAVLQRADEAMYAAKRRNNGDSG